MLNLSVVQQAVHEHRTAMKAHETITDAVRVPDALSPLNCQRLIDELGQGSYRNAEDIGAVRQEFEFIKLTPPCPNFPLVEALRQDLLWLWLYLPQLGAWTPNDIAVQRYLTGHSGIGPHRDFGRDKLLVAVFSLAGHCQFRLHHSHEYSSCHTLWTLRPGDLVLLRGPELSPRNEATDEVRPIHSVSGPINSRARVSLAYRMTVDA